MNIAEFATRSGVGAHTLRYYEKIGLLPRVARNRSGHRQFTELDLVWIAFVTRLKRTGMPLADILRYAELRSRGETTAGERMALLKEHAVALENRITAEQEHLARIRDKIAYYRSL